MRVGPFPVGAVVLGEQGEPDGPRVDSGGSEPGDEHQIAEGLAHLLALVGDHSRVAVHPGERMPGERRSVPGAHVVVREDQVAAAALHREVRAEFLERDHGAFDVPAGPSRADRRRPGRFAGPRGAPEQRVERVSFARALGVSPTLRRQGEHLGPGQVALLAEGPRCQAFRRRDVEVDVRTGGSDRAEPGGVDNGIAGGYRVGDPGIPELRHGRRDLVDHFGDGDVVVRRDDRQRLHVGAEEFDLGRGEFAPVDAGRGRAFEQRVVDVGDVLGVVHPVAGVEPDPLKRVEGQVGRRMAEVGRVVRGDAADVEPGRSGRFRFHEGLRGRVVQPRCARLAGEWRDLGSLPGAH